MPDRQLPALPNLEQYKKQAKDLVRDHGLATADALERIGRHHPRLKSEPQSEIQNTRFSRTDAQLVIAREHGFDSWPKFAAQIETLRLTRSVASIDDPVAAFIQAACVPRDASHNSGTLEHAEMILARYPRVARSNIHTAAILADEAAVREFLARDPKDAIAKGGPHGWDALTHLCFSRYLRIDQAKSEAFTRTARVLLDAGASANTGWYEVIDQPNARTILESAIYGAAGIAQHVGVTRLLLEWGADPNDEETPYHVPEGYDDAVMKVLLESGKLNETSLCWMLVRKTDWHDEEGIRLLLEHGADPNLMPRFGNTALQHAILRDNDVSTITLLLDHGANPSLKNNRDGRSAVSMAARRGRGDILTLFEQRGVAPDLQGVDQLIAACARDNREAIQLLSATDPGLIEGLVEQGGILLSEFAGNGNLAGVRNLIDLGIGVAATNAQDDVYFDGARNSTALHTAAWRARHAVVKELIARGAPVNAADAKGRTALILAVKACVDSYWKRYRTPESVEALLRAGATVSGIEIPCGYDEVDTLLRQYSAQAG